MCRFFATISRAFVEKISVGLAELQEYHLTAKCKVPGTIAVATSVFVLVVTIFVLIGFFALRTTLNLS